MDPISDEAVSRLRKRFETCQYLGRFLDVEKTPDQDCSDLPCKQVCPLHKLDKIDVENRRSLRKTVHIPVRYGKRLEYGGLAKDLSIGGIGVKAGRFLNPGDRILVKLTGDTDYVAEGVVAWIDDKGRDVNMGVRFTRTTQILKQHLVDIMMADDSKAP